MPDVIDLPDAVRVRAAVCPLHGESRVSSAQVSQALHGHPLQVLERREDWHRVRAADGYEGWVHRGFLVPDDAEAWRDARMSLGCTAKDAGGACVVLPLGALLRREQRVIDGETVAPAARATRFPARADAIVASALQRFEGTSYQWGGVTPWGADCSGLTQAVFALHGVRLPRDAWQQAELPAPGCAPVEGGIDAVAPGDLLFFSDREDGRITHVGLAAGERRMVHLALGRGGYAVERLDDAADGYVAKLRERFTHALRPALGGS